MSTNKNGKNRKNTANKNKNAARDIADVVIKESGAKDGLCRYRMISTDDDISDSSKS